MLSASVSFLAYETVRVHDIVVATLTVGVAVGINHDHVKGARHPIVHAVKGVIKKRDWSLFRP